MKATAVLQLARRAARANGLKIEQLHADVPALIADLADRDPGDLDITWRYQFFGQDVTSEVLALMTATDQLDRARRQRDDAVRAALVALRGAGLSQRVIGDTVGLSKQRIHQILHESDLAQSA